MPPTVEETGARGLTVTMRTDGTVVRFVFTPPAEEAAGLLSLPWDEPLESWQDDRLVEIRQRGISRHVVRFAVDDGALYALKELGERFARREYHLLRSLTELGVPSVDVVGVAVDRGPGADAILVTKFLTYATTYRAVFSRPRGGQPTDRLLDALVELLVRLHLSGFFWGTARCRTHCSATTPARWRPTSSMRRPASSIRNYPPGSGTGTSSWPPNASTASSSICRPATCCRRTSTRWRSPSSCRAGTRRCGRSSTGRRSCARTSSDTGSPNGCDGSISWVSTPRKSS